METVEDDGQIHSVVVQAREVVGLVGIAVPAVFGAFAVFYFAFVRGICGGLQEIFDEVHGVVEHVVVGAAYVDVQFAAEFRAQGGPVALQHGA